LSSFDNENPRHSEHLDQDQDQDHDHDYDHNDDFTEPIPEFDKMDLREELLRGLYAYGFEKPSQIQQVYESIHSNSLQKSIPPFSKGRDVIVEAQSGTGKTAIYSIGTATLPHVSCSFRTSPTVGLQKELRASTCRGAN
jgi:superfamily II DNA/RNA helicase